MAQQVIGTTRNVTNAFRRYRDDARRTHHPGADMETAALLNSALGGATDVEMASTSLMAPLWVQKSEKVRTELSMLKERLTKLKEAHGRALLVSFGEHSSEAQAQADVLTRELQSGFKRVNKEIGAMEDPGPGDDAEVQKQVRQQLARALMGLTHEFRREETRFLNKVEAQKGLAAGSSLGLVESDSSMALDSMDPGFTRTQVLTVDNAMVTAEERDKEIQSIVNTITELAQIMRDLGALVVEQGTMLDRIDHNIQDAATKIETGVGHIKAADQKQKAGRMFTCIVVLVVLIIIVLILVVAKNVVKGAMFG